jgi:diguanylate cyclase (GGDEF)-like protein
MNQGRDDELERLERQLARERQARLESETIAERTTRQLYEGMARSTAIAELLGAVAIAANEAATARDAIETVLELVCKHTRWPLGHGLLATADGEAVQSLRVWHKDDPDRFASFCAVAEQMLFKKGIGLPGRVLETGEPAWIIRVTEDSNFPRSDWAREAGLEAAFALPVLVRSEVRAVLEFFSTEVLSVDATMLRVMGQVGAQLGRVIEREAAEARLTQQALYDELTGLPNRRLLMDRIAHLLAVTNRTHGSVDLLFLDLDDFKLINDSLGHQAGDELLARLAERVSACLRTADTVSRVSDSTIARLGGDEFAIVIENCADPTAVARRLFEVLRRPLTVQGQEIFVACSIGIAFGRTCPPEPEELLAASNVAMHVAKRNGKNRMEVFEPAMREEVLRRHQIAAELRRAVEGEQLRLSYQPEVAIGDGRIVAMEALMRWQHPLFGMISPAEFIPIAEDTGIIVELGLWALGEACRQATSWRKHRPELSDIIMAVNVSGRQLRDDGFVEDVRAALDEAALPLDRLCIEVTESVLMEDDEQAAGVMRRLRAMGVGLAVDDFGTGYSSLAALNRFPTDTLKIDRSFVARLPDDEDAATIVRAIVRLGHNLNLTVVAEGVETQQQLVMLHDYECDLAQGFHVARPVPAEEFAPFAPGTWRRWRAPGARSRRRPIKKQAAGGV